jgi:hypothetical protein
MRIPLRPARSRNLAARGRILLAAAALLGSHAGCGSSSSNHAGYACTATCPSQQAYSYDWCLSDKLQDALAVSVCPAQTHCTATATCPGTFGP